MSNRQTRSKGNKTTEVDEIISFWNPIFFDEEDEDEPPLKTVDIPVLIEKSKGDKRSNTTKYKVPAIEYFESNVEIVLSAMDLIDDQIMESVRTGKYFEDLKSQIGYLKTVCTKPASSQALSGCLMAARKKVLKYHEEKLVPLHEGGLSADMLERYTKSEREFYTFVERKNNLLTDEFIKRMAYLGITSKAEYRHWAQHTFEQGLRNELNTLIFGSRAHEAYEVQLQYLNWGCLKPYKVKAVNCFRRIDMLVRYLKLFPPSSQRNKMPTAKQWEQHYERVVTDETLRAMKKSLLPKHLGTKLNELEEDWRTMSDQTFLNQVEKLELADDLLEKEKSAAREKLKRKTASQRDEKSHGKNSNRVERDRKSKKDRKPRTTSQGKQRYCELCKAAGVPEEYYTNHSTANCRKKEYYQKKLSGNFSSRSGGVRDFKREARKQEKRAAKYKKMAREFRASRKSSSSRSSSRSGSTAYSSDSSAFSDESDTSH